MHSMEQRLRRAYTSLGIFVAIQKKEQERRVYKITIRVKSARRTEFVEVTREVEQAVAASRISEGMCHLYTPHTTAGITINEHDDPAVVRDIEASLDNMVPRDGDYRHVEGNSDAHIKATLIGNTKSIFVESGKPVLGRWEGIFFCEFDGPRIRDLHLKIVED